MPHNVSNSCGLRVTVCVPGSCIENQQLHRKGIIFNTTVHFPNMWDGTQQRKKNKNAGIITDKAIMMEKE